jgi:hypothetical protein
MVTSPSRLVLQDADHATIVLEQCLLHLGPMVQTKPQELRCRKHSAGVGEWVVWWQCVTTGLVRPVVSGVGTRG